MLPYSTIGEQNLAPVAQLAERCSYEAAAEGSSPSGSIGFLILDFPKDIVAEWSKATDSSSVIFGCAGSNPADVNFSPWSNGYDVALSTRRPRFNSSWGSQIFYDSVYSLSFYENIQQLIIKFIFKNLLMFSVKRSHSVLVITQDFES